MRIPIQYALTFPTRLSSVAPTLNPVEIAALTFEAVDNVRFPALDLGRAAGRQGPRASAALIAADDVAVERFLGGSLGFGQIAGLCADAIDRFGDGPAPDLDELIALDAEVRAWSATATPFGASSR
jgi:1-deoxy-D-xylulose-5-phosphate reductoisomerase